MGKEAGHCRHCPPHPRRIAMDPVTVDPVSMPVGHPLGPSIVLIIAGGAELEKLLAERTDKGYRAQRAKSVWQS